MATSNFPALESPAELRPIEKARRAFIERNQRPTYAELGEEFHIPTNTIGNVSANESWPAMRSAHLDAKLKECDAQSILLAAVQCDRSIVTKFASLAIVTLDKLTMTVESIEDSRAPQTKAQALNTCMFAAQNLAKALHEVGIIGVSKRLDAEGKEDNGRWNPQLLHQINVTVQNLANGAKQTEQSKPEVEFESDGKPEPKSTS